MKLLYMYLYCFLGVVEYMDVWKKFDGVGIYLVDFFCNSLCGSDY